MGWHKSSPFIYSSTPKNGKSDREHFEPPLPFAEDSARARFDSRLQEQSVPGEEEVQEEMSGLEQELGLSLGVLIDVVDEQWMRDTLPADGASPPFTFLAPVA